MQGTIARIATASKQGASMESYISITAVAGLGLAGDRYALGEGSWNKGSQGRRQVTLINMRFVDGSGYDFLETRRNIGVHGVELMKLVGEKFAVGAATFRGVKYCDPCDRPTKLAGKETSFRKAFQDCGGLVAEILVGAIINVGDAVIPPKKDY